MTVKGMLRGEAVRREVDQLALILAVRNNRQHHVGVINTASIPMQAVLTPRNFFIRPIFGQLNDSL